MTSEPSNNYSGRAHTRDHIIQDYGRFLDSATISLELPTAKHDETEIDRLQVTYDLFEAVNWAKYSGDLLLNAISLDFSAIGGSVLARGGFFQTRHYPGQRVTKYPLIPDGTGILPKSAYESLLKEMRILCHAPLKEHDNIVQLTSIQWARIDPVVHSWIPVLILEEAQHGSLQQYVMSEKPDIKTCFQLSQEIGCGLQALHASLIVHGDLKFENVLVFDLGDGRVRAKLSDFGSSVIKDKDHQTVTLTTGTLPWTSPEHNEPVDRDLICCTDTYSYGLLLWKLCLGGQSPFDGQDAEDIWRRKRNDLILGEATLSLEENYRKTMLLTGQEASVNRFQSYKLAASIPRRSLQYCLSASIEKRDLDEAVESLHFGLDTLVEDLPNPKKSGVGKDTELFAKSSLLVNHLRLFDVPRSVKAMLYQCLTKITESPKAVDWYTGIKSLFQLSLQTFDGFGQKEDSMALAVSLMRNAALAGDPNAQVMLRQFYEASGLVMDATIRSECEASLIQAVEKGSLLARIWLRRYNPEALQKAEQTQAQEVAGVSLGKEEDSQFHLEDMVEGFFSESALTSLSSQLSAISGMQFIWLSQRKNSFLHTGAAFGVNPDRFRAFLGLLCSTVNARDIDGNTPLLLAVRFDHVEIAKLLLEHRADASLTNHQGETPWHWLVAIEKLDDVIELIKLMKRNGSSALNIAAEPQQRLIDIFGIVHGGTALHWAVELGMTGLVRTLVSCGADIQSVFKGVRPIDIAIRRNKPEILRLFLEELRRRGEKLAKPILPFKISQNGESNSMSTSLENYISQAVAWHPFHERLAYGGKGWVDALRNTLRNLREFNLALNVPIQALPQLLHSTGDSTAILEVLSSEDLLEGGSDQAKFWADVAETIIATADTTNVLYAMKRAKAYSADGRIPNAEKLLDLCTESFGCDGTVVDMIASEGIKMDILTQQSRTPLMGAILNRNFEIANTLIQHGADVNAMWKPIYPNSPDKEHPNVNILYEYLTANLDTALAPLRYLLEPLHSKKDLVPSFIVIPSRNETALHIACENGNPLIVDYILKKFNTPYHLDFTDNEGSTALHLAVFHGHANVARQLCEKGARVDILDQDESLSPEGRCNALDYCYRLFAPDVTVMQQNHGLVRGLEDVYLGRLEISKMLVRERQAVRTVGSADNDNMVWSDKLCLYAAQKNMSRLLIAGLEDLRNNPVVGIPWQDALDRFLLNAVLLSQARTTKLLVEYGANVNQVLPGDEKATLLHQVVMRKDAEMAYLLLRAGAEVNAYDKAGKTPLSYGLACKDWPTYRVLKHFGGTFTMSRDSMARSLVKNLGVDMEHAMDLLQDRNIHMVVTLAGEISDDGTTESDTDEGEEEETDKDL
ncbi:serine threonine kinase [Fusarium mundagurra]|uniref:Serine threonine kinase n=1 Tax=Fusarium mundagurra TaxID=1567541 RepID=A0A8H6D1A2_9HYPO|nr:serine threonine kinase [Fusarium mundagurra]